MHIYSSATDTVHILCTRYSCIHYKIYIYKNIKNINIIYDIISYDTSKI